MSKEKIVYLTAVISHLYIKLKMNKLIETKNRLGVVRGGRPGVREMGENVQKVHTSSYMINIS